VLATSRQRTLQVDSPIMRGVRCPLSSTACTCIQGELKVGRPHDVPHPTPPGGIVINATAMTLGIQHGEMKQLVRHELA
jgi:hypothetical protein